ncbi:MAG: hypothetical protein B7Y37_07790 [Sphingobacteriia bacterium 28-36-52]|nr:MAG: hypothetical protein B7Y37_07790 [Sphingobacteriia bacterium 28-36-52]
MRKRIGLYFFVLAIACTGEKMPKQVIPINDMSKIMWDLMKVDEYFIRITVKDSLNKLAKENIRLYDQVFRSYGIERKKFYDSYAYYTAHPEQYKVLIDSMEAISTKQRASLLLKTQPTK